MLCNCIISDCLSVLEWFLIAFLIGLPFNVISDCIISDCISDCHSMLFLTALFLTAFLIGLPFHIISDRITFLIAIPCYFWLHFWLPFHIISDCISDCHSTLFLTALFLTAFLIAIAIPHYFWPHYFRPHYFWLHFWGASKFANFKPVYHSATASLVLMYGASLRYPCCLSCFAFK